MRHPILGFLLAAAIVTAGCTGGGPAGPAGDSQGGDGTPVKGRVQDDQLRPLAGVQIEATDGKRTYTATSGSDGSFDLGRLVPADYALTAQLLGFHAAQRKLIVRAGEDQTAVIIVLTPLPVAEPHLKMDPKSIHVQYGLAYQVGGDFNRGCVMPGITCQGLSYPAPQVTAFTADPTLTPLSAVVLEEVWTANSPVCAKAVAIDVYNPDAPSTQAPDLANPHYWTNYPHATWSTRSPVVMVIPRAESGNSDAIDDPKRMERNGGRLWVQGNWTIRHFPPGSGLTNQAVDVNCFTDQKFDIYWTAFYGMSVPQDYKGRP